MSEINYKSKDIDITNSKYSYNTLVKTRLIEWKNSFCKAMGVDLNYSAIAIAMNEQFGIKTSAVKVSAMFDPIKKREIKLQELVALAQLFNIPVLDICQHPTSPSSNTNFSTLVKTKNKKGYSVSQLNNKFYEGKYYCYYFKPKRFDDQLKPVEETEIEEALMDISIKNGRTVLTLEELKHSLSFYGEKTHAFTLSGDIYHFENTDIAYSFINDPTGRRAMAIMFTYLNLSADVRYYITAGFMTFSLNQHHDPIFQKMAIFRQKQDYTGTDKDVLQGILSLNSGPLILDKETCQKLIQEDKSLITALSPAKALKECFVFSETAIRSELFSITNSDEKTSKQLKIRKNSLYPAHELISEPDYFADFIKTYQQMQMAKTTEDEN